MANLGQINQIISNNDEINALYPLAVQGDTVEITQGIVKLHAFPAGTYTKQADSTWTSAVATDNAAVDKFNILSETYGIAAVHDLMQGIARMLDVSILLGQNIGVGRYDALNTHQQRLYVQMGSILLRADYPSYFALVGHQAGGTHGLNPTTHFRVQDGRGCVQRYLNDGASDAFIDPDAAARDTRYVGGSAGNLANTVQQDEFELHGHEFGTYGGNFPEGADPASVYQGFPLKENRATSETGASENRGKNIAAKGYVCVRTFVEAFTANEMLNIFAGV